MRLGVDAYNLAADRRGMGRVVRTVLERLQGMGVEIVLIQRARDARAQRLDAVWYPWNGMRFAPGARSTVTIHDPFAFTFPASNPIARLREQAPIRRALARADAVAAVSSWTASEVARLFPRAANKLSIVPNGVADFWRPVPAPPRAPYFLFLAAPEKRKNARLLFDAYARAFPHGEPALIVAGSAGTPLPAGAQALRPNDEDLRALYSGALAVLVPSLAEGYGLPAAEAMACGAPVLASNSSALPETCGGAALLLAPEDLAGWSRALQTIVQDRDLRAKLRERGFARAAVIAAQDPARQLLALLQPAPR